MGHLGINLNYAVKLAVPETHTIEPKITTLILCTTGVIIG